MIIAKKKLLITGESIVDDKIVCVFTASIDYENPEKMAISQIQRDKEAYKNHCEECRADYAAFEDAVWAIQSEMIEAKIETIPNE